MALKSNLMEFIMLIGRLKTTKRTGWVLKNVQQVESVADHMYRMSIMAFLASPKDGLDQTRCIKLSLVHDMAESIVGDIAPADGVSIKEDKHSQEKAAMEHITSLVDHCVGQELNGLWREYEFQTTPEARFVKDLDKFDMILQAYEYEQKEDRPGDLQDFYNSTKGKFQTDQVKEWVDELYSIRNRTIKKTLSDDVAKSDQTVNNEEKDT